MARNDRYERYGWDYAHHRAVPDAEVAWYLRHATETGGPILELACGTGTLLVPLAEAGFEVTGLDLGERMLDLARQRIAERPAEVRARIRLVRRDMTNFDLGKTFPLILIADNSFREAETLRGLHAILRRVRRHLRPGGRLLITERRFDAAAYPDGIRELPWSPPLRDPETSATVRRRITIRHDPVAHMIRGVMVYRTEGTDGVVEEEELPFESPVLMPEEYVSLFASEGFSSRLRVGYQDRKDDGIEPMLCFIATAARPLSRS